MLQKIGFAPGINKQVTATGAESQWIDCDNVRFRYGTPEKICLLYTSPSPRDTNPSRMPSSA